MENLAILRHSSFLPLPSSSSRLWFASLFCASATTKIHHHRQIYILRGLRCALESELHVAERSLAFLCIIRGCKMPTRRVYPDLEGFSFLFFLFCKSWTKMPWKTIKKNWSTVHTHCILNFPPCFAFNKNILWKNEKQQKKKMMMDFVVIH